MKIKARLQKLEGKIPKSSPESLYSLEDIQVARYEIARILIAADRLNVLSADLIPDVNHFEEAVRSQARMQAGDQYKRHLDNWVTKMWLVNGNSLPFISPVIGSEYDDWELPDLSARRLSVRLRGSIIALIGEPIVEGGADLAPFPCFNPFDVMLATRK